SSDLVASLIALSTSLDADLVVCAAYQNTPTTLMTNSANKSATAPRISRNPLLRGFASSPVATGAAAAAVGFALSAETIEFGDVVVARGAVKLMVGVSAAASICCCLAAQASGARSAAAISAPVWKRFSRSFAKPFISNRV